MKTAAAGEEEAGARAPPELWRLGGGALFFFKYNKLYLFNSKNMPYFFYFITFVGKMLVF
jgi:hypothetical protein